jgi:hypothetical protein
MFSACKQGLEVLRVLGLSSEAIGKHQYAAFVDAMGRSRAADCLVP